MSSVQRTTPVERKVVHPRAGAARAKRALELIATRGREVIGVRHLLEGCTARVGDVREALARVPMIDVGGRPVVVGEVTQGEYVVHVPPRARGRMHAALGIPRLLVGPQRVPLGPGDRAVVVIGQIQIRARVVEIEAPERAPRQGTGLTGWIVFVVAIYLAALTVCAALAPPEVPRLPRGALRHVQADLLHRINHR